MSIPILSKKFFDLHAPNAGFYSHWRELAPWTQDCLPIYEWQGVLFVGCLLVPKKFPKFSGKVVFVLCDPESLKEVWYEYQGTVVGRPSFSPTPAVLDAPDGFLADITTSTRTGNSQNSLLVKKEDSSITVETDLLTMISDKTPAILKTKNPLLEVKASPQKIENIYLDSELTATSSPTLGLFATPQLEVLLGTLHSEMNSLFQKSMILLKDDATMKPWNWDSNFRPAAKPPPSVSLAEPSPWRIVMKTHMPYHGYLVPCEVSSQFFESWNNSQTPEHLTLAPIIIEEQVIGMILGIGQHSADTKTSLQLTERWAREFAKQIKSQPELYKAS